MLDALLGFALIAGVVVIWTVLGLTKIGRVIQAILAAMAYLAWLSIIPLIVYFTGANIRDALIADRPGEAVFVALVSLTFIPIMMLPLIPWNYFCQLVWRKTGLKLPQTERLGGARAYYDAERE